MKLSQLREYIAQYDTVKGVGRRIFGDAEQIKALKLFIHDKEISLANQADNPDIRLEEFKQFASEHNLNLNLSAAYLSNNSASATIFEAWQTQEQEIARKNAEIFEVNSSQMLQATREVLYKLGQQTKTTISSGIYIRNLPINQASINKVAEKFSNQPEDRKKLSTTRFWKQPENFVEASAQTVVNELLKNPDAYHGKVLQLPEDLKDRIFTYLSQANDAIEQEKIYLSINSLLRKDKELHECHNTLKLGRF